MSLATSLMTSNTLEETPNYDVKKAIDNISFQEVSIVNSQFMSTTKPFNPLPLPPKPKTLSNTLKNYTLTARPFQRPLNNDKKSI